MGLQEEEEPVWSKFDEVMLAAVLLAPNGQRHATAITWLYTFCFISSRLIIGAELSHSSFSSIPRV